MWSTHQVHESRLVQNRKVWIQNSKVPLSICNSFLFTWQFDLVELWIDVECCLHETLIGLVVKRLDLKCGLLWLVQVTRSEVRNVNFHAQNVESCAADGAEKGIARGHPEVVVPSTACAELRKPEHVGFWGTGIRRG